MFHYQFTYFTASLPLRPASSPARRRDLSSLCAFRSDSAARSLRIGRNAARHRVESNSSFRHIHFLVVPYFEREYASHSDVQRARRYQRDAETRCEEEIIKIFGNICNSTARRNHIRWSFRGRPGGEETGPKRPKWIPILGIPAENYPNKIIHTYLGFSLSDRHFVIVS